MKLPKKLKQRNSYSIVSFRWKIFSRKTMRRMKPSSESRSSSFFDHFNETNSNRKFFFQFDSLRSKWDFTASIRSLATFINQQNFSPDRPNDSLCEHDTDSRQHLFADAFRKLHKLFFTQRNIVSVRKSRRIFSFVSFDRSNKKFNHFQWENFQHARRINRKMFFWLSIARDEFLSNESSTKSSSMDVSMWTDGSFINGKLFRNDATKFLRKRFWLRLREETRRSFRRNSKQIERINRHVQSVSIQKMKLQEEKHRTLFPL